MDSHYTWFSEVLPTRSKGCYVEAPKLLVPTWIQALAHREKWPTLGCNGRLEIMEIHRDKSNLLQVTNHLTVAITKICKHKEGLTCSPP